MIDRIQNGLLLSDLDADGFNLLNVGSIVPVPLGLVADDDPRLTDARAPLDGSVTNESVAEDAAIAQSKLNLNGGIPAGWLGTTDTTAARGDLAEYIANKGQPDGYASLDSGGLVPVAQLPDGAGSGTVTSVGLTMPAEFNVTGSPITSNGAFAVAWANAPGTSWFGNDTGGSATPAFKTTEIPGALIPDLDAAKITTGVFDPDLLPVAVGVGVSHAPGAVPDPEASGDVTDYLARDMTYQPVPTFDLPYQPNVPDPTFTVNPTGGGANVIVTRGLLGSNLFYAIDAGDFAIYTGTVFVATGSVIYAYGAAAGYNNSSVVNESI